MSIFPFFIVEQNLVEISRVVSRVLSPLRNKHDAPSTKPEVHDDKAMVRGNMHTNLVKFDCVVLVIRLDRNQQTDNQTDILITIFGTSPEDKVVII